MRNGSLAVVGMGYVGLPLAVAFAESGVSVCGLDLSQEKMQMLNSGKSYIEDIPSSRLQPLVAAGLVRGSTDFDELAGADAISICVPTPLSKTRDPEMSYILAATKEIVPRLKKGQTIILESTTYPGTTREVILPLLEETGLKVGVDFFLAFSPERIDPGRKDYTTKNTPKVLGGITQMCVKAASAFYEQAIDTVVPVSSPEVAEMVKILENTFRAVNIGLVNEVLLMCERLRINAWEVIEAAATKPFGFMKFTPGPGLGGHCIPIDPHYLTWKLKSLNYTARFIELASEVNTGMPAYWVRRLQDRLNDEDKPLKGSRILVIGVAYKKDISDVRESPAIDIIAILKGKGAVVSYHDPHIFSFSEHGMTLKSVADLYGSISESDGVIIATDHSFYDWSRIKKEASLIVDTRNVV